MTEFNCPNNPTHKQKLTDTDEHFDKMTCISCGSVVYRPKEYSQIPVSALQTGVLMPEKYEEIESFQEDITDDEQLEELMCSETARYYS